jgi:hypothetical protein
MLSSEPALSQSLRLFHDETMEATGGFPCFVHWRRGFFVRLTESSEYIVEQSTTECKDVWSTL